MRIVVSKKLLLLVVLALGLGCAVAERSEFYCFTAGKKYAFVITSEQQRTRPKWDPKRRQNPPLSAAKALKKATDYISHIDPGEDQIWNLDGASLIDVYGWLWRVRFSLTTAAGGWNGPPK